MIERNGTGRPDDGRHHAGGLGDRDAAILSDLRDFARDIGLGGAGAMTKDEIVEGLRQHYLLQTLLGQKGRGSVAGH